MLIAGVTLTPIAVVAVATYWNDITGQSEAGRPAVRTPPSTTATTYVPNAAVELSQPFVGTPAAGWKNGIGGIGIPKPKAVGDISAAEVADAVKAVRKSIQASYFDRQVIERHNVDRFLNTLAPDSRRQVRRSPQSTYVVLVHRDYPLLPASPKSNGTISVLAGEAGELIVRTKFAVAYAFDTDSPDSLQDALDIVAVVKSDQEFRVYSGPRWQDSAHGVHLITWKSEMFAMSCEHARKGYLAPYYADRATREGLPEQEPEDYFDPAKPLTLTSGCAD